MKVRKQNIGFNETIKKRDDYKCKVCLRTPIALHLHHLLPYKQFPKLRFDTKNVVSMCADCHSEFHSMYGNEFISDKDFEEYRNYKRQILPVIRIMLNSCKYFDVDESEFYNMTFPRAWADFRNSQREFSLHDVAHFVFYPIALNSVLNHVMGCFVKERVPHLELLSNIVNTHCVTGLAREGFEMTFSYEEV